VLRRAALFGRRLGLDKPFVGEMARAAIEQMGHVYPELVQRQDFILQVTELEEARFSATLSTGLELLDRIVDEAASKGGNRISGEQAFKLYDTYGFPKELTEEIAAERGLSVDLAGFEKEMERQREQARKGYKVKVSKGGVVEIVGVLKIPTKASFVGYHNLRHKTSIFSLFVSNNIVEMILKGEKASLILESTPFYGEMGGQVGDTGEIISPSGRFSVTNTIGVPPDIITHQRYVIIHQGYVTEGSLTVGDEVEAEVDRERRLDIARNHTATHLLQSALRQVLGEHVQQRGSLVAPDRLRFDFSHLTALTREEIDKVNQIVNDRVRYNLRVYAEDVPYKKAIDEGAIALFDEKYGDKVRVVKIGEPAISAELCGGTHVASSGEIGFFHIISESSIGAGLRRIEAVTGRGAEKYIGERLSSLEKIGQSLGALPQDIQDKLSEIVAELDKERKRTLALERQLAKQEAEALLSQAVEVKGVTLVAARVSSSKTSILREMADLLRDKLKSAVIVLGTVYEDKPAFLVAVTPDLVARGYDAGKIVKQIARVTGGSGGGKPSLAQAGGKDKGKLDEALKLVKSLI